MYYNTLGGSFLNWDDTLYITQNPLIKKSVSFESFKNLFYFDQHICLVLFSFLIQYNIIGLDPYSYHIFNIIFHAFNVILVYILCKNLIKRETLAIVVALLFAVHPLRSETVGWIMQRKDILYTTFFLISLLSYQLFIKRKLLILFILIFLSSFLSSLCKIQAFTLPFILLLFEYYYHRKIDYKSIILFVVVLLSQNIYKYQNHGNIGLILFYIYFLIILPSYHIIKGDKLAYKKEGFKNSFYKITDYINKIRFEYYILIGYFFFFVSHKETFLPFLFLIVLIMYKEIKDIYFRKLGKIAEGFIFIVLIVISGFFFKLNISLIINILIILICIPILHINAFGKSAKNKHEGTSVSSVFNYIGIYLIVLLIKDYLFAYIFYPSKNIYISDILLFLFPFFVIKSELIYNYFSQWSRLKRIVFILLIISLFSFLYLLTNNLFFDIEKKNTIPLINRIYLSFYSINYYLYKFIYPFNLSAMIVYPDGVEGGLPLTYKISSVIFLIFSATAFWIITKIKPIAYRNDILFGILFFLINISLVLHIIPIGGKVIVADRYTYLAYLGLFVSSVLIVDFVIHKYKLSEKVFILFWGIIIIVLALQCYGRNRVWQNDLNFWTDIIEKDSTNHYAQFSLGLYFYEAKKYELAVEQYDRAIAISNKQYEYYANRAACYIKLKKVREALSDFEKSSQLNPNDYATYNNRGNLYLSIGDITNSIYDFRTALKIKEDFLEARKNLEKAERLKKAIEMYEENYAQSSELSLYYSQVGVDKAMNNLIEEALPYFELSVKYDTLNIDAIKNRGNGYAILKRFEEAERDLLKVLRLKPDEAGALMNLANIKHETGYINIACDYWHKAFDLGLTNAQFMIDKFCK